MKGWSLRLIIGSSFVSGCALLVAVGFALAGHCVQAPVWLLVSACWASIARAEAKIVRTHITIVEGQRDLARLMAGEHRRATGGER